MTSFVQTEGKKEVYDLELTTTGEVDLVAARTDKIERTLECIRVVSDGTSSTLTIKVKNGSTTKFKIVDGDAITSTFQITEYPRPLLPGHSITVQAGTADHLWVSAIVIERPTLDGRR